ERYDQSFFNALDEFYQAVVSERSPSATAADGHAALAIALACMQAAQSGKAIEPSYI
ncbi:MAG: inositol 2-dehydrogenase, partial [Alphaproteobacteria bacterium]